MMDHFPGVIFNDAATRDSGLVPVALHAKSMPEQEQWEATKGNSGVKSSQDASWAILYRGPSESPEQSLPLNPSSPQMVVFQNRVTAI